MTRLAAGLLTLLVWMGEADARELDVAVMDLTPVGASADTAQALTAIVAAEVGRYDGVRPVTRSQIVSLLGLERQKQLLGCTDTSCATQIVDALGVTKMITGQLGRVEDSWELTLQWVDVKTGHVEQQALRVVPINKGELVNAARSAVTDLMGQYASSRNQPPRLAVTASQRGHVGERVVLDASRSYDPDGDAIRYAWRQLDGPPAPLEQAQEPIASFVAVDVGSYRFAVSITDGRSPPIEHRVSVEVLEQRTFRFEAGIAQSVPFDRFVLMDQDGNYFRNRTPFGPTLGVAFRLNEEWLLIGEADYEYMNFFPEAIALQSSETLDVQMIVGLLGVARRFPFDRFELFAQAAIGSSRMIYTAVQDGTRDVLSEQYVMGELLGGVDIPFGERFGLLLRVGLRTQLATEPLEPFNYGIRFGIQRNGFFWGLQDSATVYFRL